MRLRVWISPCKRKDIVNRIIIQLIKNFALDVQYDAQNKGLVAKTYKTLWTALLKLGNSYLWTGSCHKRQKAQAPTPRAPIRNRQTRKVANAKGLNHITNLT